MQPAVKTVDKKGSDRWEKLEKRILKHHLKILKIPCQRACTVALFLMYSILEGCRSDDLVKVGLRLACWIISTATILYTNISSIFVYIFSADNMSTPDIMILLATYASAAYSLLFLQFVTYYNRNELRTIIEHIDKKFLSHQISAKRMTDVVGRRYNSLFVGSKLFVLLILLVSPIMFMSFFYAVFFCDESDLGDQQLFMWSVPFVTQIHSYRVYVLVYLSIISFPMGVFISFSSGVLLPIIINCEFYNAYYNVCTHLHNLVNDTISKLKTEPGGKNEIEMVESNVFLCYKRKFAVIIKQHQFLTRSMQMIRPFTEFLAAVNLIGFFFMQIPLAYILFVADMQLFMRVKIMGCIIITSFPLYGSCYFGNLCEEMAKMMSEEVYFSHWYDLPPKFRQIIHIFLCQTQTPIKFTAFKMYPVTMNMFAKALNCVYKIINFKRSTSILTTK